MQAHVSDAHSYKVGACESEDDDVRDMQTGGLTEHIRLPERLTCCTACLQAVLMA